MPDPFHPDRRRPRDRLGVQHARLHAAVGRPTSAFTFTATVGIIILAGVIVGASLGWAGWQRRTCSQYRPYDIDQIISRTLAHTIVTGITMRRDHAS